MNKKMIYTIRDHYGCNGEVVVVTKAGVRFLVELDSFYFDDWDDCLFLVAGENIFIPLDSIDCIYSRNNLHCIG